MQYELGSLQRLPTLILTLTGTQTVVLDFAFDEDIATAQLERCSSYVVIRVMHRVTSWS